MNYLDSVPCCVRSGLFAVVLLAFLPSARAREVAGTAQERAFSEPTRYSLGAGLGFVGYGDSGLGVLTGLGAGLGAAQSRTPFGSALAEIEASAQWRVVVGMAGSYNKMLSSEWLGTNALAASSAAGPARGWTLGGSMGVRRVLNPGGAVEVSPIVTFGGYRTELGDMRTSSTSSVDGTVIYGTRTASSAGYDGRLGLVLEHALLPNLFLRFESYFLRVGYGKSSITGKTPESPESSKRKDLGVGYGLAPSLLLRLSF